MFACWLSTCQAIIANAFVPAPPDAGSPVYEAIRRGDRDLAFRLIETGEGMNAISQQGRTALYWAIARKDEELVDALLEKGANPHYVSRDQSALNLAAQGGSLALVRKLHARGVDADPKEGKYPSALYSALCSSSNTNDEHWQLVIYLIPLTDVNNAKQPFNLLPIYCAAGRAPVQIIAELLARGARIPERNSANPHQRPILFTTRNVAVMRLLVEHGADVHARDRWNRNLLHYLEAFDIELAKFLIDKAVDVNARDNEQRVPLFSAVRNPDPAVTELLLNHGADVSPVDKDGANVIFYAATPANVASTRLLLTRGISANVRNTLRDTPVHATLRTWDSRSERPMLIRILLESGVDLNAANHAGITALHVAAANLDVPALQTLLTHGARPNQQDRDGRTALHFAAGAPIEPYVPRPAGTPQPTAPDTKYVQDQVDRKERTIRILLEHGARKAVPDRANRRPSDLLGVRFEERLKVLLQ